MTETTPPAETTRKSKRQVPSWGITKADLMRMHGEEVAKLKARIAALENPSESRKSLAAKRTLMDSIWADEIGSKGMVMLFLHDLTDKGLVKSEMKPKGKSLVRVLTALDNSSESLTGRAADEGSGSAPEITGKQVYYLGVCEKHRLNESFVLKSYRSKMPKHWREQRTGCCHSNCYQDATDWLIVDLSEATFKK